MAKETGNKHSGRMTAMRELLLEVPFSRDSRPSSCERTVILVLQGREFLHGHCVEFVPGQPHTLG